MEKTLEQVTAEMQCLNRLVRIGCLGYTPERAEETMRLIIDNNLSTDYYDTLYMFEEAYRQTRGTQ